MRSVHALALLLSASAVLAQQEPHSYSISGRLVNDAGAPIPNAEITPSHHGFDEAAEPVLTDAQGHFSLTDLPAGQYTLNAHRRDIGSFFYGQSPQPGIVIGLSLNEKTPHQEVTFRIALPAIIEGTVRTSAGTPPPVVQVIAKRRGWLNGSPHIVQAGSATTDGQGHYRLTVTRGSYRICAQPLTADSATIPVGYNTFAQESPRDVYVETCQPDSGSSILLAPAQKSTVDLTLTTGASNRVSGKVTNAPPNTGFGIYLQSADGDSIRLFSASVSNTTHEFQFQNVEAGQYWIHGDVSFAENGINKTLSIHQALFVGESDVNGLNLTLQSPPSIHLVIHSANNPGTMTLGVRSRDDPEWGVIEAQPNPGGSLQIRLPHAGTYWLTSRTKFPFNACIASARYGKVNALAAPINVPWDSHETLEVTTTDQYGSIKFNVTDETGKPNPRTRLLILFSGTAENPGDIYLCSPEADGGYEFDAMRPGSYPVWVWNEIDEWNGLIGDLASMSSRQTTVTVKSGKTTTATLQTKETQ